MHRHTAAPHPRSSTATPAIYTTADIMRLFRCGKNAIASLVEAGVIPKPLGRRHIPHSRRIWAKAVVDRALGLSREEGAQ